MPPLRFNLQAAHIGLAGLAKQLCPILSIFSPALRDLLSTAPYLVPNHFSLAVVPLITFCLNIYTISYAALNPPLFLAVYVHGSFLNIRLLMINFLSTLDYTWGVRLFYLSCCPSARPGKTLYVCMLMSRQEKPVWSPAPPLVCPEEANQWNALKHKGSLNQFLRNNKFRPECRCKYMFLSFYSCKKIFFYVFYV